MTGDDLRGRRFALCLSQTALAEALGVDQRMLSRWETGTSAITAVRAEWLDQRLRRLEQRQRRAARKSEED